jgi:hypothetical protein
MNKLIYLFRRLVCPYCDRWLSVEANRCCGEAGHGEWRWVWLS